MATVTFYGYYPPGGGGGSGPMVQQVTGIGSAGSPDTGVLTVQGIAGMTPLLVSVSSTVGKTSSWLEYLDYALTPVTTGAYVQLIASTTAVINYMTVFDSSGQTMILATGAPGSEIDQIYIPPGGNSAGYPLNIPTGTRISLKALSGNATSGNLIITGLD